MLSIDNTQFFIQIYFVDLMDMEGHIDVRLPSNICGRNTKSHCLYLIIYLLLWLTFCHVILCYE